MKATEKYDHIMAKLAKLGVKKIKSGNVNYPKFINTEVLNTTCRIHYKYMSSDITRQKLERIQKETHPLLDPVLGGDFPDLEHAIHRHNTSMFLQTIQIYSTSRTWPTCASHSKMHKCQVLNESHTPDIVLVLHPEERSESLEIPALLLKLSAQRQYGTQTLPHKLHLLECWNLCVICQSHMLWKSSMKSSQFIL